MCAGPHFVRGEKRETDPKEGVRYTVRWPTQFGNETMPKVRNGEICFGPENEFVSVLHPCESPGAFGV